MKFIAYHGTNCRFTEFKNETEDDTNIINAIFFTKDINVAKDYASSRTGDLGGVETVIKAEIEINNPMSGRLEDCLEKIKEYATKVEKIEEYEEMYENFQGHDTQEFAKYVIECEGEETGAEVIRWLVEEDWGFDGEINEGGMYTVFSPEQIKIIEITEE